MKARLAATVLTAVTAVAPPAFAAGPAATERSTSCRTVKVRVALVPGGRAEHPVVGRLCAPRRPATLQLLLSGATYGSVYWDPPVRAARHSYVLAMRRAGEAVLSIDRIGTGASAHPPSPQVGFDAHVHVVHQLVQAARAGELAGMRFERVVTVGHSLGSAIALVEAARHDDVDGLVLTGFLAHADPVGAPDLLTSLHPAALEPRFRTLDPGYLTTWPGTRGELFYHRPSARADVIALDERTKETLTAGELAGVLTQPSSAPVDEAIDVPVLSVVGEFDNVFCPTSCATADSPAAREAAHYPNAPSFESYVVPRAGHVVNLHDTAPAFFEVARGWLARRAARAAPRTGPAQPASRHPPDASLPARAAS